MFLNSRARNTPEMFAHTDFRSAPSYMSAASPLALQENHYTMVMLSEPHTTYGQVLVWENEADASAQIRNGLAVDVGHGYLIFDIQLTITEFLLSFCFHILPEFFTGDGLRGFHLKTPLVVLPEPPPICGCA
ncbi:hypothetical protein BU23DRAFT_548871 [Bimuria novae-zelandiae CBS 107.79]|uniref:Uncharacterized protein n=1 Tax=Bimuria novae-zelandiae CBS 107.79 TaxID=1447943 RepID=A0A6A5VPS8_9PLEO|nr:hypothetical protein BU23DRAFT_548871 [Bimuria novae-zelandiae CBS 107.79]